MSSVKDKVKKNDRSMANTLPSAQHMAKVWRGNYCCGIHGAARERKGIKHATSTARRRLEREYLNNYKEEE